MEHLRIDYQTSPLVANGIAQDMFHYVWVRGRCSLVELFPIYARKEGFSEGIMSLLSQQLLTTDLKSITAREKQVVFSETPLSCPEDTNDDVLAILNQQTHVVGEGFTYAGAIYINRDFQLQWHKIALHPRDKFHLGHFYDFRGRMYPKGHILTYQGTDFQKSLIRCEKYEVDSMSYTLGQLLREQLELDSSYEPRVMSPTNMNPREWLMVDVARSYGMDKDTWRNRWLWATSHPGQEPGAKEPFLYQSALAASTAVETDHLVSLDATASGIQCLALMAQDSDSALAVNLGTNEVRNPYQMVKDYMGPYPYERVKKAVMTSFYESVATPRDLFGDDYEKFVDAASKMLPGPWAIKEAISSCMTYKDFYSWTMMDGFVVNMEVTTPVECKMDIGGVDMTWTEHRRAGVATKGLTANVTHSLDGLVMREVIRRANNRSCAWNDNMFSELREKDIALMQSVLRWKVSKFVSFELFEHMDEENGALVPDELREELNNRAYADCMYIQPIHDCIRVKATDASKAFVIYREVMADLAYAKTAAWILPQLGFQGRINDSEAKRSALREQVLDSSYLIC